MSIYLKTGRVKSEWTDYNGHMNLAFYIHLFDSAWEVLLQKFNIGEDAAKIEKRTTLCYNYGLICQAYKNLGISDSQVPSELSLYSKPS